MTDAELMRPLLAVVFGLFGSLLGSFTNVVILRMASRRSVIFPPSSCPHCGRQLTVADLVPVLSWLALRGRCRTCRAPIHWQYPLVEAATALVLAQAWLTAGGDFFTLVGSAAWGVIVLVVAVCWLRGETSTPGVYWWPVLYRLLIDLCIGWRGHGGVAFGDRDAIRWGLSALGALLLVRVTAGMSIAVGHRLACTGTVAVTLLTARGLPWQAVLPALALATLGCRRWPITAEPGPQAGRQPLFTIAIVIWAAAGWLTGWR